VPSLWQPILNSVPISTNFPNTGLGRQLETAARIIGARDELHEERTAIYADIGGWDTHNNQVASFQSRVAQVRRDLPRSRFA
jgi:uncharacterized protein (DUF1501 family)